MGFDQVYEESRGELYVALALATGSRDVAADTVDEAFRGWHGRVLRRRLPEPDKAAVMSVALRRIARMTRDGADVPQGFRLRSTPLDEGHRGTLREFRSLPLAPRMALVLRRRLGWQDEVVAAATGLAPDSLDAELSGAMERLGRALGVDTEDARTMLDHALDAEADGLREPLSRAASTKSAGLMLRFARAAGTAAFVTLASLGVIAGISAIDFGSSSPEGTVAQPDGSQPPESTTVATGPPTLEETTFAWASGGLPIARNNGDIRSVSTAGDQIVIVGMEYTQRAQAVIARSTDGVDWELLGAPFVGDGDIVGVAAAEDLFVAAGNRWDGNGSNVSVWISTDGFDWVETPLPVTDNATINGVSVQVYSWVQQVEILGDEIMVVLQTNAELDERTLDTLLPGGLGNGGWGTSQDGIQVYDERGQSKFFTWDELGLPPEEIALLSPGARVLTSSDRGETWVEDSISFSGGIMTAAAGGDLVAVVATDLFGPQLWIRSDGAWERSDIGLLATSAAVHSGMLYVTGENADGQIEVWRSADGEDWEAVLGGIGQGQFQIEAGASGLMTWSVGDTSFARAVDIEIEGYTVQVHQMGGVRVIDPATGDVVAEFSQERVYNSNGSFPVTNADGEVLFELNGFDIEQAFAFPVDFEGEFAAELRLYVSSNGLNWSRVVVDGELPESFFAYNGAPLGNGGVALLGWDQRGEGQQLWIGSPAT